LAEAERELGLNITEQQIAELKANLEDINYEDAERREREVRHDVMAHVRLFGEQCPAARPIIHLGATSAYVTDNTDLIQMRRGLDLLRGRVISALRALAAFAKKWKDEPTLGYTHLQSAQLTTVGKRATLWMQDLVLDLMDLDYRRATLPFRGVKGTTGTQASFLQLFDGDHEKVRELDRRVTASMDFTHSLAVTGQTYTRKLDAQVLGVVAGIAASAAKFASDIRMLQAFGEIEEPFERDQIGSSAMAYKRNPMRAERMNSLARFVIELQASPNHTHSVQYFERTLDDSANRRLVIPESFLATDAILVLMANVVGGLEVHPARIRRRIEDELPFMATEELIVRAVRAGGNRQDVHEVIRRHSIEAARALKNGAPRNDLLERLAADPEFGVGLDDLQSALDPHRYVGRAPQQVDEFLSEAVAPVLAAPGVTIAEREELRV
jgi:adenylosuccinate lyase